MAARKKRGLKVVFFVLIAVGIAIIAISLFKPTQEQLTQEQQRSFQQAGYGKDYLNYINSNMVSGGPPKDGIPALDHPTFVSAEEAAFLKDEDKVFGFVERGVAKAFPQSILYWHEIVNDESGGDKRSVTYCPLTGSVIGFKGKNLGVSGKLYNSNLVMYDRETGSEIPQMLGRAVNGQMEDQSLNTFHISTTTWKRWKSRHPDTLVLSTNTGYSRDYTKNPYPGYSSLLQVWFPVAAHNDLFPSKKLVHGVFYKGEALAIPKEGFKGEATTTLAGEPITITHDSDLDVIKVYDRDSNQINSYDTYWFAWYAYYPTTQVYGG